MSPELLGSSEQQQGCGSYTPAAAPASTQKLPAICLRTAPRSAFKSRLQYSDGDEVPASLAKAKRVPQSARCACMQLAGLSYISCNTTTAQLATGCLASHPGKRVVSAFSAACFARPCLHVLLTEFQDCTVCCAATLPGASGR